MERLQDKVAVITGAGQGIGAAIARRFAEEGADIVVAEMNPDTGPRTVTEIEERGRRGHFIQTDVGIKEQAVACVEAAVEQFGRIDCLVNNAWGGGTYKRFEFKTDDNIMHGINVGYLACFWTMQAAFEPMVAQGGGSIINICSLNGVNAHRYSLEYNAAKEAARTMTRTAAVEWGRHFIRCNVICPGAATDAYKAFASANPDNAAKLLELKPMPRMGDPDTDIAPVALFLASDDSVYITGNTIYADGGTHVNGAAWNPQVPDHPTP